MNKTRRGTEHSKKREGDPGRCFCLAWDLPYEHHQADHSQDHWHAIELRARYAEGES